MHTYTRKLKTLVNTVYTVWNLYENNVKQMYNVEILDINMYVLLENLKVFSVNTVGKFTVQ